MRHHVWIGHGDDDPHGLDLNDDHRFELVDTGLDLGVPDPMADRRTITLYVRILGHTENTILRGLEDLSRWVTRANQRHSGTVKPLTLRISGDALRTVWFDAISVELVGDAQAWQFAARGLNPVVRLVCLCRAYGRTEPVTLVEGAVVEPADPVLVLPPVDTDAPAELEVDIDDLTRGGTGANRWRLASMPLSGAVPPLTVSFARHEPVTLTASGATATGSGAVTITGSARVQAPLRGLSPVEGWVAMRLRPAWASTGDPLSGAHPYAWAWADSGTSYLLLRYRVDLDRWEFGRAGATVRQVRAPATPFAAGDGLTLVARWSATEIALSLNGGPFVVSPHSDAPALAATLYDIGSFGDLVADSRLTGDVHWFAAGTGGISEDEAAALAGLGDTDPGWSLLPAGTVLRWTADSATEAEAPVWGYGTLEGGVPPSATVRQDWQTLATGEMTWPDDTPPPQHVELFARVADMEPVGAPIERISATAVEGPLHTVMGESNGNTVVFHAVPEDTMLVAVAQAQATEAFTWPNDWTVQTSAAADGYRLELATKPIQDETETESVTVTAPGGAALTLNGWAVPGANSVVSTISRNSVGQAQFTGNSAYHAVIAVGFAVFPAPPRPFDVEVLPQDDAPPWLQPDRVTGRLRLSGVSRQHNLSLQGTYPIQERQRADQLASITAVGNTTPGTVVYRPMTVTTFESLDVEKRHPVTGNVVPLEVMRVELARTALLVGVALGTQATAPNVPAGTYRVGVTGMLADGRETPLLLTVAVRARGLQPIAAQWYPALQAMAGVVSWRLYYQPETGAWRYVTVDGELLSALITNVNAGTQGDPPQAVALTGAEIRAIVRSSPAAAREVELFPASCRVGMGQWELVPLGVLPPTLIPNGRARLSIEVQARTAIGARRVALDRVLLLPVSQELGGMVAEVMDVARSVPMRWRHHIDPDGRHGMRLWGTLGNVVAEDGIQYDLLGVDDVDPEDRAFAAIRFAPRGVTVTNLLPGQALTLDGPHWVDSLPPAPGDPNPTMRPGLPLEDAGDEALTSNDPLVLRAQATGTISPAFSVTQGSAYTASGYVRIPTGGSPATVALQLVWYQGDGRTAVSQVTGDPVTTTDEWQVLIVTGTAPAGAVSARVHLVWEDGTADVWLDAVQVNPGTGRRPYQQRHDPGPNLLNNTDFTDGAWGWQLYGTAVWSNEAIRRPITRDTPAMAGAISDPIRVQAGATYTLGWNDGLSSDANRVLARVHWFDAAGDLISTSTEPSPSPSPGVWRIVTVTAPAGAALAQVAFEHTGTNPSPSTLCDNVRFTQDTAEDYVAPTHAATSLPVLGGAFTLWPSPALPDLTAERGWAAFRFTSLTTATATLWQWRADDDNHLIVQTTADEVQFHRVTESGADTVSVPRPRWYHRDLTVFVAWTDEELTIRLHDGDDWGEPDSTASTTWPELVGDVHEWWLGARRTDAGTTGQFLWGRVLWAIVGRDPDGIDPTATPALTGDEPIPDDVPDAAGLAWLWTCSNPGRLIVWREGGYATVAGEVTAWDRPTALVIIGEDAARGHHIGSARVTVRAIPRLRYLGGA